MPRRNSRRPRPRKDSRPDLHTKDETRIQPELLAQRLVDRGIASPMILSGGRAPRRGFAQ